MKRKVRYYRTWCGTYSSALGHVLLGWLRLVFLPSCWGSAWRRQKRELWHWPTFRWTAMHCECPAPGGGRCFACHMIYTLAAQPFPEPQYEEIKLASGYIAPGEPGADCPRCGHWWGQHYTSPTRGPAGCSGNDDTCDCTASSLRNVQRPLGSSR